MVCDTCFYSRIARIKHTNHASRIVYSHLDEEPNCQQLQVTVDECVFEAVSTLCHNIPHWHSNFSFYQVIARPCGYKLCPCCRRTRGPLSFSQTLFNKLSKFTVHGTTSTSTIRFWFSETSIRPTSCHKLWPYRRRWGHHTKSLSFFDTGYPPGELLFFEEILDSFWTNILEL